MAGNFVLPPTGFGPGSQLTGAEGAELEYMPLPQDMRTYVPRVPEVADPAPLSAGIARLARMAAAAGAGHCATFDLSDLDAANRALVSETLGEGEVSARIHGIPALAVQESVFAGIWVLKGADTDMAEVGPVPAQARTRAFHPRRPARSLAAPLPPGVVNAPPLVTELQDRSALWRAGMAPHVVNLTLLPHTEQDLAFLDEALGRGSVEVLSRGYGNCRLTATALAHVWRVQFFNSMDTLILDTFEVTDMPEVALAAAEDLADSAERLNEVLEALA
ncbi:hydrogenase expression/formation protein [Tropicimonas sp. IMCC34043]|uniref:hydrogenase expression/formation protein n=1 Tax=Tropicimonas sp. IMCC34043 TaxID=2248760 RepID=UPI000E26A9EF|nr:hydrogenase expression/formation protein [Tropicimonas sp. IMCC34043]